MFIEISQMKIFCMIPKEDIFSLSLVCKKWNSIVNRNEFVELFCKLQWPNECNSLFAIPREKDVKRQKLNAVAESTSQEWKLKFSFLKMLTKNGVELDLKNSRFVKKFENGGKKKKMKMKNLKNGSILFQPLCAIHRRSFT